MREAGRLHDYDEGVLILGRRIPPKVRCTADVKVAIDDAGTLSYWFHVEATAGEFAEFLDADGCYDEFDGETVLLDSVYAFPEILTVL